MTDTEDIKVKRNLTALVEFSRIINSSFDLPFILNNVLLTCMGKFLSARGVIALNVNGKIKLHSYKGVPDNIISRFPEIESSNEIIDNPALRDFMGLGKLCVVEKINSSNDTIGILCLGEKLNKTSYTEDDHEFLKTILNISATAIQNSVVLSELEKVNRVLDSRINRLSSLFELSKEFGMLSESHRVSKLLVYSIIGQFLVSRFAVVLSVNNKVTLIENKFNESTLLHALKNVDISSIKSAVRKNEMSLFPGLNDLNIELIVPMQLQGVTKGLILLGKRINNTEFTEGDLEFIYSIGSLAIISIENNRLFKEELEKQKMEEELEIARDIQRNLLPHEIPVYSRYDIAALNISSKQVGGDFYDIIKLNEHNFCITIADVSGKGVPAALLMANLQAFLKIICKHGFELSESTALINDLVCENTMDGKFITFFWGLLNNEDLTFTYVNAGHNPPLLIRNNTITKLEKGGIILGVMKTFTPYISDTIRLQKDDVIICYTDGITEAKNKNDDEFGDDTLEKICLDNISGSSDDILHAIKTSVQKFSEGTVQSDDITAIIIKVN